MAKRVFWVSSERRACEALGLKRVAGPSRPDCVGAGGRRAEIRDRARPSAIAEIREVVQRPAYRDGGLTFCNVRSGLAADAQRLGSTFRPRTFGPSASCVRISAAVARRLRR